MYIGLVIYIFRTGYSLEQVQVIYIFRTGPALARAQGKCNLNVNVICVNLNVI